MLWDIPWIVSIIVRYVLYCTFLILWQSKWLSGLLYMFAYSMCCPMTRWQYHIMGKIVDKLIVKPMTLLHLLIFHWMSSSKFSFSCRTGPKCFYEEELQTSHCLSMLKFGNHFLDFLKKYISCACLLESGHVHGQEDKKSSNFALNDSNFYSETWCQTLLNTLVM